MGIQITLDEGTFFAWMKGWKQLEIRDGKAAELGDQNGKRMFADLFITIVFFIQFLKKGMKIKQKVGMFLAAVKDVEFFLILEGKTDPVHTDRIIRKRRGT